MSLRIDANEWISGALLIGETGLGVAAEAIPSAGADGASYLYNDLDLPADNGKEICGRITSWPTAGSLYAYEDGSFGFTGAPDGAYSFDYQLYVDGVATGSPTTVSMTVGILTLRPGGLTNASTFYAAVIQAGDVSVLPGLLTNTNLFWSPTVSSDPTIGRPASDASNSGWTPSTGTDLYAMVDEVTPSAVDYISASSVGAVCQMALNTTAYPGSASQVLKFRASSSTGNSVIVRLKEGATVIRSATQALTATDTEYSITLTSGEIAAITSGNLSVELESA